MSSPRIIFAPQARRALGTGFSRLADLMEVTLGPKGRLVAFSDEHPARPPALLNDGATIARRFHSLPVRAEAMGALLARHIAWRVEEAVGDGTTTAVVVARHLLQESERLVAAGHNAMDLRRGLEKGSGLVLTQLRALARPLEHPDQIAALATSITGDETLGAYVEEIFDIVGAHGAVEVRSHYGRKHDRRYIQGTHWNNGWASSYFTTEGGTAILKNPYLLFTNHHLTSGTELAPILEKVRGSGERGLVVIASSIQQDALNILVTNKMRQVLPTLAVKAPGVGPEKSEIMTDLAVITGGRLLQDEAGSDLTQATLADLGQADEVQAIRSSFSVVGGKGRPAAIRRRIEDLRAQLPNLAGSERERMVERAGKLLGGVALLEVGGDTDSERTYLKERANAAVRSVRQGLAHGIVPGGGVALLACIPALQRLHLPPHEAVAVRILERALTAPAAAILRNSGFEAGPILARLADAGYGCGFDVMGGRFIDMAEANILDPVEVVAAALRIGVSGALMALTTDVLVHKPRTTRDRDVDLKP